MIMGDNLQLRMLLYGGFWYDNGRQFAAENAVVWRILIR